MRGIRVDPALAAQGVLARAPNARDPHSREVEIVLPDNVVAACAMQPEVAAVTSPFALEVKNDQFWLTGAGEEAIKVSILPQPRYYGRETSLGTPMWQVGAVTGNYISIDPAATCGFAIQGVTCAFCTLKPQPAGAAQTLRPVQEVVETVRAAFDEGVAEFVYFNTGYFDAEDGGFSALRPYIEAVKNKFDTLVAVQAHPPADNQWIDRTYAAGVDALCYNVEVYDADLLAHYCKGRTDLVGRNRYFEALAYAAKIFPSGTVWSDLIVGLEPPASTTEGIDALTAAGVLPVLSLFRPLQESALGDYPALKPDEVAPIYAHLYRAVRDAKINVQWMRDLGYAVTPIEARYFAGEDAKFDVAVSSFYKSKIGSRAVRGLSKLRRRLRVKEVRESFDSSKL